jgi:hypothetical protein
MTVWLLILIMFTIIYWVESMTSEQSKGNNSNSKERQKKINRSAVVNKKTF